MAKNSHYIDNKKFLEEIIKYKKEVKKAKRENLPKPGVNNYIGQCFMDIAENLAKKPNFANYPFKEEMIGDAVENCMMYTTNFDPAKSKNPFAFFTQIIFYAFLRRIQKEKKQLYIKMKQFEENDPTGKFRNWLKEKFEPEQNPFSDILQLSQEDVEVFEKKFKIKNKKKTSKKTSKKAEVQKSDKPEKTRLDNFMK
jgi:hypothetical protein